VPSRNPGGNESPDYEGFQPVEIILALTFLVASRAAAGRMLERELVSEPVRCASEDRSVADLIQQSKTTQ